MTNQRAFSSPRIPVRALLFMCSWLLPALLAVSAEGESRSRGQGQNGVQNSGQQQGGNFFTRLKNGFFRDKPQNQEDDDKELTEEERERQKELRQRQKERRQRNKQRLKEKRERQRNSQ